MTGWRIVPTDPEAVGLVGDKALIWETGIEDAPTPTEADITEEMVESVYESLQATLGDNYRDRARAAILAFVKALGGKDAG